MKNIPYIITNNTISLMINNKQFIVNKSHPNYIKIKDSIKSKKFNNLINLVNIPEHIKSFSNHKVEVKGNKIYYKGQALNNYLTEKIMQFMHEGFDFQPTFKFLQNLMQNPSTDAINELYQFLEYGNMPITEDGYFLAYKYVNEDYTSCNANPDGSHNVNKIGAEISMDRDEVCADRNITCAEGLHFCSREYLPNSGGGSRIMVLKINPKDVVSIPYDYNNTKGRCCYYKVVAELKDDNEINNLIQYPIYTSHGKRKIKYGHKPSGQRYYNMRDKGGKFARTA